ncbi:MAG: hypothetical protein ACK42Z_08670 [Candidatus Kapaibacteriota bacterium]
MKSIVTFVELIRSEDIKIKWLLDTPAFNVEKSYTAEEKKFIEKKKNARWHAYNLIPCESEGYEHEEEMEYYYKALCYTAARGIYSEMKRLYEESSLVEVFEMIMFHKAFEW